MREALRAVTTWVREVAESVDVANALRVVIFIGYAAIIALAAVTVLTYARRYIADQALARVQGRKLAWRGLLPIHVMCIGTSYIGVVAINFWLAASNLDRPLSWRTIVGTTSAVLGTYALWSMLRWQRRLYPRHDEQVHVEEHPDDGGITVVPGLPLTPPPDNPGGPPTRR